jgi:hypothetical protein
MHSHAERFTGQENRTVIGTVARSEGGGEVRFRAERALADWSLAGSRPRIALSFLNQGRRLAPRLAIEAQRRFQAVPTVRLPDRP